MALWLILTGSLFGLASPEFLNKNFAWDSLTLFFSLVILTSTFFACLLGYSYSFPSGVSYRRFLLLVFSISSLLLFLAGTQNLLYFLVLWTLVGLLFFLLLHEFDARQAWNYLVLDLVSSLILLCGVAFLYGITGALNLTEIKVNLVVDFFTRGVPGKILPVSLDLISIGLVFKLGLFPFYFWLGSFHKAGNLLLYSIFSLLIRPGLLAFAMRFWLKSVLIYQEDWQHILFIGAAISTLWGGLALLLWRKENRGWLYLDLIQIGLLASAIAAGTFAGLAGGLFFLWGYLFGFWGLVFIFTLFRKGDFDFNSVACSIKSDKLIFVAFILLVSSMVGLPLTAGFWGKHNLFKALLDGGRGGLVLAGLGATLLVALYFIPIFKISFSAKPSSPAINSSRTLKAGLLVSFLASLLVGLFPDLILKLVLDAAAAIPF